MMSEMITIEEAVRLLDRDTSWKRFQVDYPEARLGNFSVEKFTITKMEYHRLRIIRDEGMDRDPGCGTFTRLVETIPGAGEDGDDLHEIWMSDTRAEIMEHSPLFNKLWWAQHDTGPDLRILINGLGLGVVVHGILQHKHIEHIDVVESNDTIIDLVGPLITDPRVAIHRGDAFDMQWPRGTGWDFAWHDIWPTIDNDNLPGMRKLIAKYKRRVLWQDCWQRHGCLKMERAFRRAKAGTLPIKEALDALEGRMSL
jgi:hypothetical protein